MGFLTTIVIYNDALHDFEEKPKEFAEAIFKGINEANYQFKEISIPFSNYFNYLNIHRSRHANDPCIFLHYGNGVTQISSDGEFREICKNNPDWARKAIKQAESLIKDAKKCLIIEKKEK